MKKHIIDAAIVVTLLAILTQTAGAVPPPSTNLPDAGTTSLLLGGAFGVLACIRRFFR